MYNGGMPLGNHIGLGLAYVLADSHSRLLIIMKIHYKFP